MADMLQFELVSPERRLASVQATEVQIPGAEGDMTALADHAPTITTLRPGVLRVVHAGGADEYVVSGGFAEISGETVSVLAERALPKAEMTQEVLNSLYAEANDVNARAKTDASAKVIADVIELGQRFGLTAS